MKKQLYFAYGSNIWSEQMKYRMYSDYKYRGTFTLKDYKLTFNTGYEKGTCFANIEPSHGDETEGVLYELTSRQMSELDRFEALYTREYFDHPSFPDTIIAVYVGLPQHRVEGVLPDVYYVDRIIRGCEERGLIKTMLQLQAFKESNYKAKKLVEEMRKGEVVYKRLVNGNFLLTSEQEEPLTVILTLKELKRKGFKITKTT